METIQQRHPDAVVLIYAGSCAWKVDRMSQCTPSCTFSLSVVSPPFIEKSERPGPKFFEGIPDSWKDYCLNDLVGQP